jgi:hypothetical protein
LKQTKKHTQEAELSRITVRGQPIKQQKKRQQKARPCLKNSQHKTGLVGVAQVIEGLSIT